MLADLRRLIVSGSPGVVDVADGAPLITSGLLESTLLLDVALWVEDRVGTAIELGELDLAAEWDTMDAIVTFVERQRRRAGDRPPPHQTTGPVAVVPVHADPESSRE